MFHYIPMPGYFTEGRNMSRPPMVFSPEQPFCQSSWDSQPRRRCRPTPRCWSGQMQQCCGRPTFEPDYAPIGSQLVDLIQPVLSSLGNAGTWSPPNVESQVSGNHSCRRERCTESADGHEETPVNFVSELLGQLFNANANEENSEQLLKGTPFADILQNVVGMFGEEGVQQKVSSPSKWKQEIDCSGFRPNNIRVKMSGGDLIVKAVRDERCRDGTVSIRTMEKRIPIPKDVIAKSVSCKMQGKSILIVEGQRKTNHAESKKPSCKTTEHRADNNSGDKKSRGFDVKVLPNGAIMFTTALPQVDGKSCGNQKPSEKAQDKRPNKPNKMHQATEKYVQETAIPVQCVASTDVDSMQNQGTDCKPANPQETDVDPKAPQAPDAKTLDKPEDTCCKLIDEETSVMCTDALPVTEEPSGETPENVFQVDIDEQSPEPMVELAESDDDAASTGTKDSESSFILLNDQDTPDIQEVDINDIKDALAESEEIEDTEQGSNGEPETKEKEGAQALQQDITQFIQNVAPGLQNLISNVSASKMTPQDALNPQNIAEMIKDSMPSLQSFIVPTAAKVSGSAESTPKPDTTRREDCKEFNVRLELPTCAPDSIRVTMDDEQRMLNISINKDSSNEKVAKTIAVPENVNVDQLRCQFKDGMLGISAPYRSDNRNTRDIPVSL